VAGDWLAGTLWSSKKKDLTFGLTYVKVYLRELIFPVK
jgi:hypothetical protein